MATPLYASIIDDSAAAGFAVVGTWTAANGLQYKTNFNATQKWHAAGTGTNTATWTFTAVPAGTYKVYASYCSQSQGGSGDGVAATNAPYTVFDNTTSLGTVTVNQARNLNIAAGYGPYYDYQLLGTGWKLLGTYTVTSGTLKVQLSDNANAQVMADAIRVVDATLDAPCLTPATYDDDLTGSALSGVMIPVGGIWAQAGGVLQQTQAAGSGTYHVIRNAYQNYPVDSVDVLAKFRVDTWAVNNANYRAGVGLDYDSAGNGYNLVFDGRAVAQNTISFLDEAIAWGNSYTFPWTTGTYYWFRLRREGLNLYGRVWADGSAEPTTFPYTQAVGSPFSVRTAGAPGLNGNAPMTYDQVTVSQPDGATACGAVTITHPTAVAAGVMAVPRLGAMAVTPTHPTFTAAGKVSRQAVMAVTPTHPTGVAAGVARGIPTAAMAVTPTHPTFAAAGVLGFNYHATAALVRHPTLAAAGTAVGPAYHGRVPPLAVTGIWNFDEPAGTTSCVDSGGGGLTGTLTNIDATTGRVAGRYDGAINLGANGSVAIPAIAVQRLATIAFWYLPTGGMGTVRDILRDAAGNGLYLDTDNTLVWQDPAITVRTVGTVQLGVWVHLAMQNLAFGYTHLFRNGADDTSGILQSNGLNVTLTFDRLGYRSAAPLGWLDSMRVYGVDLTAAQVLGLARGTEPGALSRHPTAAAAGVRGMPSVVGVMAATPTHPSIAAVAHAAGPVSTGTARLVLDHPLLVDSGHTVVPTYVGTGVMTRHPTLVAVASWTGPGLMSLALTGSVGDTWMANLTLAGRGHDAATRSAPLAIPRVHAGGTATAPLHTESVTFVNTPTGLNLAVKGPIPVRRSADLALAILGDAGVARAVGGTTFVMAGSTAGEDGALNLAVVGFDAGGTSGLFNLAITGGGRRLGLGMTAFVRSDPPVVGTATLVVAGAGVNPFYVPDEAPLNLSVARGGQGGITLVALNCGAAAAVPLWLAGSPGLTGSTTLAVAGTGGSPSAATTLAIPRVATIPAASAATPLAIPVATGGRAAVTPLYINGWSG